MAGAVRQLRRMAGRLRRASAAWLARARRQWPMRLRLWRRGLPKLAPGRLPLDDRDYRADHLFLVKQAGRHGPVFKTTISGAMVTCVVDHRRSRTLLTENESRLGSPEAPYSALVPGGFLRTLSGETHRRLRRVFVHAVRPAIVEAHAAELRALVRAALADLAARGTAGPDDLVAALERIATGMMLIVGYGVRPGEAAFDALGALYRRLGPRHFVWKPEDEQRAAAAEITKAVRALVEAGGAIRPSILQGVTDAGAGTLPDPVLGNLIYMVEMGREDIRGLFRWVAKYLGDSPGVVAAIRAEAPPPVGRIGLAEATVLETLRLDQSEGIMRRVHDDVVYEGMTIPAGSFVRACTRDTHRDPAKFADPEGFDPSRFLVREFGADDYSPFGFDHHICLAGDLVIRLGAIFVGVLARDFDFQVTGDGPRHRGVYHWEPSPRFAIRLAARAA